MEANPSLIVSSRVNANAHTNSLDENNNNLLLKAKHSIMDAMSTLVELNRPNLSFKFDFISSDLSTSSILINTAEKSFAYRLPCKLVEAELKKNKFESFLIDKSSPHFYQLLRKIIDLNKAYYMNLGNQEETYTSPSEDDGEESQEENVERSLIEDTNNLDDRSEVLVSTTECPNANESNEHERDLFSEQLTRQLIDESFDQLAKYDQFASTLVDGLFDELRATASRSISAAAAAAATTGDFSVSPLNIIIPEMDELDGRPTTTSSSDRCGDATVCMLTPKSNNSSTANTPPLYHRLYNHSYQYSDAPGSIFRRHSADVDKILLSANRYQKYYHVHESRDRHRYDEESAEKEEVSSRRHSLHFANSSQKETSETERSELTEEEETTRDCSEDNDRQSRPRQPTPSSYDERSDKHKPIGLVLDNNKYLVKKPPVIALMLTTSTQSKDDEHICNADLEPDDDDDLIHSNRRPSTITSFKSNPDLNHHRSLIHSHHYHNYHHHHYHNRFKQYRKVTLRNFFQKSPNQIRKEMICGSSEKSKSLMEKVLEKSSYVNSLVCDIVNDACLEASNTINSHVRFAKSLETNIFSQVYDEIRKIENLNQLKHIFFHCECLNPQSSSVTSQQSYLTCKITVYSMIIALNESNFTNLVTFKCSHLNNL